MYHLSGSVILGWALGANDAANVFGTAVASRMVRYRTAVVLAGIFVVLGALLQGTEGFRTLSGLTQQTARSALIVSLIAGLTVILMTALRLPVSASQAVVGAILGMGIAVAPAQVHWGRLWKIVGCWIGTPLGSAVIAALLYPTLGWAFDHVRINFVTRSIVLKAALLISGCYGAYALGANNVANVTGVFYRIELLEGFARGDLLLAGIGGLSIAFGAISYGRNVMLTVGNRLVDLGAFSAFIAILSQGITVHIYAYVGVPVSTSQAIVGAVLGIGIAKSVRTIHRRTLLHVLMGWFMTPLAAGLLCYAVSLIAY